nr:hypothetical protein [Tanacetum cinerariifolium]
MFNVYLKPPRVERPVSTASAAPVPVNLAGIHFSTTIDQDVPSPSHSSLSLKLQSPSLQQGVAVETAIMEDNPLAPANNDPFVNVKPSSKALSSGDNGIVERRNCTLVEAARIILMFSKALIEDLGKLHPTADIGIFIGYAPSKKGYRIYNKRTRRVTFNSMSFLSQWLLWLVPNPVPAAPYVPLTNKDLEMLFQSMFDEYLEPPRVERPVSPALAIPVPVNSAIYLLLLPLIKIHLLPVSHRHLRHYNL